MNILIITQDDPFYLGGNLAYFFSNLPEDVKIVGCVVTNVSPFGKKESLVQKAIKTWKIFGTPFFFRYAFRFLMSKVQSENKVKNVLERFSIPIIYPNSSLNTTKSLQLLSSYKPDLLISIAGNEIFRKPLIELAPLGCLNLHTALLPKYRGLMPSFWVLKNQEKETGVSVFFVDEGIDSGPIIVQNRVVIGDMTLEQLINHTKHLGMISIIEAINKIKNDDVQLIENDDTQKSYYSFPTREDVKEFLNKGCRFY